MRKTGKYIYGIINPYAENRFNPIPLFAETSSPAEKNSASKKSLTQIAKTLFDGQGKTPGQLDIISFKDISAVVSEVEISDYANLPKELLTGLLLKHQRVIEKIMSFDYVVIPVKFGTSAVDEMEVKDILH